MRPAPLGLSPAFRLVSGNVSGLVTGLVSGLVLSLVLSLLLSLGLAGQAQAQSTTEIRAKALYNELRCVVCAGQSIAESNAELAQDMRAQVDRLLLAGQSDGEIRTWFVARYGDAVLMNPPLKPLTYALWYGPVLIFLIGLAVTVLVIWRGRRRMGQGQGQEGGDA